MRQMIASALLILGLSLASFLVLEPMGRGAAHAQDRGVAVAVLINVAEGKDPVEAVSAMRRVTAFIARQPGLIDKALLQSSFPGNDPSHIYMMHWRKLDDWMALSASEEFLKILDETSSFYTIRPAEVFTRID